MSLKLELSLSTRGLVKHHRIVKEGIIAVIETETWRVKLRKAFRMPKFRERSSKEELQAILLIITMISVNQSYFEDLMTIPQLVPKNTTI